MSTLHVVTVDENTGQEEPLALAPERLLPGSPMPTQFVRNAFSDATGRFFGGIWRSSPGRWRVRYTENELCVLTQGKIRITDDSGHAWAYGPGDCFVIPAGFEGTWEVLESAQKFYAIYEPPPG